MTAAMKFDQAENTDPEKIACQLHEVNRATVDSPADLTSRDSGAPGCFLEAVQLRVATTGGAGPGGRLPPVPKPNSRRPARLGDFDFSLHDGCL